MPELIFEIGTEELPASYILPALEGMRVAFERLLGDSRIGFKKIDTDGTPRRLVMLADISEKQTDLEEEVFGPNERIAYDKDGQLSRAGLGFLKSRGLSEADAYLKETKKGKVIAAILSEKGAPAETLLGDILFKVIHQIPFPKRMHWERSRTFFARPITRVLAVLGGKTIPFDVAGLSASNETAGHHFINPELCAVSTVASYKQHLEQSNVVLSATERKQLILERSTQLLKTVSGKLIDDEALLDTVSNLVEKPWPLLGKFDESFLKCPSEILIAEMVQHQKYFPVVDGAGSLLPYFVVVAGSDPGDHADSVSAGHARVLRARFEDGSFYYERDMKSGMGEFVKKLPSLVFERKLGSVANKVKRVEKNALHLAEAFDLSVSEKKQLSRAAALCKADLVSGVVGEFPELQGTMGKIYALSEGESQSVGDAIEQHYWPATASAPLPASTLATCLAMADRLDTLTGIVAIGKMPKGSADPFGLRRAAIALCRMILANDLKVSLSELFSFAEKNLQADVDELEKGSASKCKDFMLMRAKVLFVEELLGDGFTDAKRAVDAVMACGSDDLVDVKKRLDALVKLIADEPDTFEELAQTVKRACNLVHKARAEKLFDPDVKIDKAYLKETSEMMLLEALEKIDYKSSDYPLLLSQVAKLRPLLGDFFDNVMVMDENKKVRQARLSVLAQLETLSLRVADFKKL